MQSYSEFRPTGFDSHITLDSIEDWLIVSSRNRDSECLDESNFHSALEMLGGEGDDVQIHRFGHWANGWFELILVRPNTAAAKEAEEIETSLAQYPVLNDDDLSEREQEAADLTWRQCYSNAKRIEYIRRYRSQFEFRGFADLLGCVRGNYFSGYVSELLNR